jgi:hypothetical protein
MDGQVTRCAQCGAPLSTTGRFCTNCGAPVDSAPWAPPPEPAYDEAATSERVYAVPDEPVYDRPLFADPVAQELPPLAEPAAERPLFAEPAQQPPDYAGPTHAQPVYADPLPPRRSPGIGLWIGAAAGLILVLVLGAFLLLSGGSGDDSPTASATPLVPKVQHTNTPPPTTAATSSAPTSSATTAPTGPPAEVAGLSSASAPTHAPAGVDFSGRPVTYVAPNMVDGVVETCWRTPGDATGTVLTFRLERPTTITKVGLINGYAKTAFSGGRRYDWYQGDRRVLSVDWIFDDGTTVSQPFTETRAMQSRTIPPVTTSTVLVRITAVSPPGRGLASRDDTAVSEVSLVGAAS